MADQTVNVVIAGLGGQGVLKASDILADAAFRAGYDVKKAEVHGMSQRGGSVTTDVRYGSTVYSPMVPPGRADFLLVLEPTQVEPAGPRLAEEGLLINAGTIDPGDLPNAKALNVAGLGMLSVHLDLPPDTWQEAIRAALPEKVHDANMEAFAYGRARAGDTAGGNG